MIAAFVVLAVVFVIAENLLVHQFQECVAAKTGGNGAEKSDQKSAVVVVLRNLWPQAICTVRVLDKHNGFFAALAGIIVAFFTFTLSQSSEKMWRASLEQGEFLESSIAQASRSATAMEGVAETLTENTKITREVVARQKLAAEMQLRAYVSVETDGYVRQDRRNHFEFRPNIVNNGQTPANELTILSKCELRESPDIPEDFNYEMDGKSKGLTSKVTLYPRQLKFHSMVFFRRCTIQEMRMLLRGKAVFHLYGQVSYIDAFKEPRRTNFSFLIFIPNSKRGAPVWHSTEHHNDAT